MNFFEWIFVIRKWNEILKLGCNGVRGLEMIEWDVLLNVAELDIGDVIDGPLTEVNVLEVGVHVDARSAEMISARHVGNNAFTIPHHTRSPHPQIPVPCLSNSTKSIKIYGNSSR